MNVVRNEIRTGVVLIATLTLLVAVLIYLGAPGVFTPETEYVVYLDNAAGVKMGTPVMLAGRKIGRVTTIDSPVPNSERPLDADGNRMHIEARVKVKVDSRALVYNKCKVQLAFYSVLSEPVFDFTDGDETSGRAGDGTKFVGGRAGSLADAGTQLIEKLDPALKQVSATLKSLQSTANNLTRMTAEGSELSNAFIEVRKVGANLREVTGEGGSLRRALDSIEGLTGDNGQISKALLDFRHLLAPDGDLAKAIAHLEKVASDLSTNKDLPAALKNLRTATDKANTAIADLHKDLDTIGDHLGKFSENLEKGADTLKHQPWRLIWPSTKKYPEDNPTAKATPTPAPAKTPVKKRK